MKNADSDQLEDRVTRIAGGAGFAAAVLISKIADGTLRRLLELIGPIRDGLPAPDRAKSAPLPHHILVVAPDTHRAEQILSDLTFLFHGRSDLPDILHFPAWEVLPFDLVSPTVEVSAVRMSALYALLAGRRSIVVTTVEGLLQKIATPAQLRQAIHRIQNGMFLDRDYLAQVLDRGGFQRSSLVEEVGQCAIRGAVVDCYPPGNPLPLRFELFDNRVESIRTFDPASQRTVQMLPYVDLLPVRESFWPSGRIAPGRSGDEIKAEDEVSFNRASQAALLAVRKRALELELPPSSLAPLEEALGSGGQWPGLEHIVPVYREESVSLWEFLDPTAKAVLLDDELLASKALDFVNLIEERAGRAAQEGWIFPKPEQAYGNFTSLTDALAQRSAVTISDSAMTLIETSQSLLSENPLPISVRDQLQPNTRLNTALQAERHRELPLRPLAAEITENQSDRLSTLIVVSQESRVRRVKEILATYKIDSEPFDGSFSDWLEGIRQNRQRRIVRILNGSLSSGLRNLDTVTATSGPGSGGYAIIIDREIFPEISARRRSTAAKNVRRFLGSVSQLNENDFIVHADRGIGIYRGLKQLSVDGKVGDFLALEYAEQAKLFVPVENIGKIQKYVGSEGKQPALTKLGGNAWEKTKQKIKDNVQEIAGQLITLYAARKVASGVSFGSFDSDDQRFADTFSFEETSDQAKAITDVLADMEQARPMDRLVCGDVGYGKTEVALRAAFKAANQGKQVAILVPTTILADQHFQTFKERFAEFPLRVACVSRFNTSQQNRDNIERLASGNIDIIVGTHRLLQKDVFFKDLGLLVIDEEHRFGVAHKERLKRMRREIDVLTLTATPIPRTLHMSLLGIRDLSIIESPPTDRQVIRTYLAPFNRELVREAVMRELGRAGQVFYIHNRVQTIAQIADELKEIVPEARIAVGHGQMKESELEVVMHKFIQREIDVLVSTTIVESGLDIPNANTIIIRRADMFGLAELYQLRGRVGRSSRQAFAYLLISDEKKLGPDAKKRLDVLKSLDDLGMGFRLALQDMEIRGAGNLLGKDQTGEISNVGFDLYSRILKDAVRDIRLREGRSDGAPVRPYIDPEIKIGFPAHIPADYIPDVEERLILYRRLSELDSPDERTDIALEIEDRFGRLPDEVVALIELMALRALLRIAGVVSLTFKNQIAGFSFHPEARVDSKRLLDVVAQSRQEIRISPAMVVTARYGKELESPRDLTEYLREIFRQIGIWV